jgi:hypothetical protein
MLLFGIALQSCGDDKDEPSGGNLTWDKIEGNYLTKPEPNSSTLCPAWNAEGLEISNYVLTVYTCTNSTATSGVYFPGFNSPSSRYTTSYWRWTDYSVHSLTLSGNRAQLLDDNRYVELTKNGVRFNGVEYYNTDYFNSNVDSWTGGTNGSGSGNGSSTTNENVTVNMTVVKQNYTSRLISKYNVTVTATGNGFTVMNIGLVSTSGQSINTSQTTSENSATFSLTTLLSETTTIVGRVTTTSGNTYESESQTLN